MIGRYLIVGGQTVWVEGLLSAAARHGAICHLDEVVARLPYKVADIYRRLTH